MFGEVLAELRPREDHLWITLFQFFELRAAANHGFVPGQVEA